MLAIHLTWRNDTAGVFAVLSAIEAALALFDARPHWGKAFTMSGEAVRATLPRTDDFLTAACAADPRGAFRNDFVQRMLIS